MKQIDHTLVDVKLTFAYLAEQPIIHTEETIGNISKLKQMRVIYNGKPVSVPALSGNSFRGQLRDILADALCSHLSNQGKQILKFNDNDVYTILYSGGALSEKSKAGNLIYDFADHLPSMRLMGSAFGNVMLPSKLAMTHIVPCAEETQDILQGMYETLDESIVPPMNEWTSAQNLIFNDGPLTRKDDSKDLTRQRFVELKSQSGEADDEENKEGQQDQLFNDSEMSAQPNSQNAEIDNDPNSSPQQMIYYVECIPAGTWLLQQVYSKFPLDQLELGCLFDGLNAFLRQPILGGRSAAGYGQVRVQLRGTVDTESVQWSTEWSEMINNAVCVYQNYLTKNQGKILKVLTVSD
ncbi:MAG: hypothetical protein OXU36_20825 [Candidatus Poribacteria bacterium]|nr:hypothetical protein [Candidatus Poribacteria bacterium]